MRWTDQPALRDFYGVMSLHERALELFLDSKGIRSKRTRQSIIVVWGILADIVMRAEEIVAQM